MRVQKKNYQPIILRWKDWASKTEKELISRGEKAEINFGSLSALNDILHGVQRRKMYVIGARTSNGKSALALQLAWEIALQKKRVMYLSLEMSGESILERLFCMSQNVSNIDLLKAGFSRHKKTWEDWLASENIDLTISDMVGKNYQDIEDILRRMAVKPDVIFIDHLQEISSKGKRDKRMAIDEYLLSVREMTVRENFSVFFCSQIGRVSQQEDNKDRKPQLHHFKESGSIEEMIDVGFLLHWPWKALRNSPKHHKNYFELEVAKNRNGMTGHIKLRFDPQYYRFSDWTDGDEVQQKVLNNKKSETWEA